MNESTPYQERIDFGTWTTRDLDVLIRRASSLKGIARKVAFISRQFLGLPYGASTLIGGEGRREVFVINLRHVDCFTFLDYVEALRLSDTVVAFKDMVKRVRYRQGIVCYKERNHFFTDWTAGNNVRDVTGTVGRGATRTYEKRLNDRGNGSLLSARHSCPKPVYFLYPRGWSQRGSLPEAAYGRLCRCLFRVARSRCFTRRDSRPPQGGAHAETRLVIAGPRHGRRTGTHRLYGRQTGHHRPAACLNLRCMQRRNEVP